MHKINPKPFCAGANDAIGSQMSMLLVYYNRESIFKKRIVIETKFSYPESLTLSDTTTTKKSYCKTGSVK